MTTFTVWKFNSPAGANRAKAILRDAESEGLVKVLDRAVVTWEEGAKRPKTSHTHEDEWRGAGWGSFWGLLFGVLFFIPAIGAAAGAAIGAITKATAAVGIDGAQLDTIREQVTPGTSALFVVTDDGDIDAVGERFHGLQAALIATNLTDAERELLLETFSS